MSKSSHRVWVVGEALVDLLPGPSGRTPYVGGGPANAAKAIANLGIEAAFIGGISTDNYGSIIRSELSNYGVNLDLVRKSNLPTATAAVQLNEDGEAEYQFKLEKTATFDFSNWLPTGHPEVIYTGSLATIIEPGASAIYRWLKNLDLSIVYDPNIRPSVVKEKSRYLESFHKWAEISRVIKLSLEDLDWLGLSTSRILELGPKLVILTKGSDGISAFTRQETLHQQSEKLKIVDTVGAGDTVGAVLVEGILKFGDGLLLNLQEVLHRASLAAAITCTRAGAKPPTLEELNR